MALEQLEILKTGSRGTVALVYDTQSRRMLVQKHLVGDLGIYRTLQKLSHPYLPKIYDVHYEEDRTVILEEYIPGGSLGQIPATEKQMTQWLMECCAVLAYLHRRGILHRDIKPSNLLLGSDGHIRLIDFDAARIERPDGDQDTRLLGTRGYAPPEQYGFAQTDERADLYALGVTFRELLGPSAHKLRWKPILTRCTAMEPKRRYRHAWQIRVAIRLGQIRRKVLYPILGLTAAMVTGFMLWSYTTDLDFREATDIVLSSRRELIFEDVDMKQIEDSTAVLKPYSADAQAAYARVTALVPGKTLISTGYSDEEGNLLFGGFSEIYYFDTGERYFRSFDGLYAVTAEGALRWIEPENCAGYAPAVETLYRLDIFDTPLF